MIILYILLPKISQNKPIEEPKKADTKEDSLLKSYKEFKAKIEKKFKAIQEAPTPNINGKTENKILASDNKGEQVTDIPIAEYMANFQKNGKNNVDLGFKFKGKNILFILDTSGSMQSKNRIDGVKGGLKLILNSFSDEYQTNIIFFPDYSNNGIAISGNPQSINPLNPSASSREFQRRQMVIKTEYNLKKDILTKKLNSQNAPYSRRRYNQKMSEIRREYYDEMNKLQIAFKYSNHSGAQVGTSLHSQAFQQNVQIFDLWQKLKPANRPHKKQIIEQIDYRSPNGGTPLLETMEYVYTHYQNLSDIVVLTDGIIATSQQEKLFIETRKYQKLFQTELHVVSIDDPTGSFTNHNSRVNGSNPGQYFHAQDQKSREFLKKWASENNGQFMEY
jgi:ABC-type enterochelin transport system ATPase subunit